MLFSEAILLMNIFYTSKCQWKEIRHTLGRENKNIPVKGAHQSRSWNGKTVVYYSSSTDIYYMY